MLPNHHITKPVFIGEIKGNGQFDVVWKTPGLVAGDAWSKELEGSKDLIGDWVGKSPHPNPPPPAGEGVQPRSDGQVGGCCFPNLH